MPLLYKSESYNIIGAAQEVHRVLGHGFLEPVYQEALAIEFRERKIPFEREKELKIIYKGQELSKQYQADFVCYESIIVELKALSQLTTEHDSQVLNYLKATGYSLGLLINFGESSLVFNRFVL
jgi:GxxExxY protein